MAEPQLLESNRGLQLVCPLCKQELSASSTHYHCEPCRRDYPVVAGIPDFRVFPDPYLGFDDDRERTDKVLGKIDQLPMKALLEFYWTHSDITPPYLRQRFVENALRGEDRGRRLLALAADELSSGQGRVLDIGCGTGNFLSVAAGSGLRPVGIDIAMRWLHLSRRRYRDAGVECPALVCCCAEYLPFAPGQFDALFMTSTFEFLKDQRLGLREMARVMAPGGSGWLNTANRYSLASNPYAHLWGVGLLPKRYQVKYVRWRRQTSYEHITLHSHARLKRLAAQSFGKLTIAPADIPDATVAKLGTRQRMLVRAYRGVNGWGLTRPLLNRITPEWDVQLRQPLRR